MRTNRRINDWHINFFFSAIRVQAKKKGTKKWPRKKNVLFMLLWSRVFRIVMIETDYQVSIAVTLQWKALIICFRVQILFAQKLIASNRIFYTATKLINRLNTFRLSGQLRRQLFVHSIQSNLLKWTVFLHHFVRELRMFILVYLGTQIFGTMNI